MSDRLSRASDRLSGAWLARGFAALSVLGLVLSVAGVAAMAIAAESIGRKTWGAYFAMEQAMAIGTPVAVAFAGLSVLVFVGLLLFPLVWIYAVWDAYTVADRQSSERERAGD